MKRKVVLLGAGGKMGCRIVKNIKDNQNYTISYVEINESGRKRLKELFNVNATDSYYSLSTADMIIFAVPDKAINRVSKVIIPLLKTESMVIGLDPAAIYGNAMTIRTDLKYFVVHPCHPSLFPFEENLSLSAQNDWFGGIGAAKMDMVCAIHQGNDSDYNQGVAFSKVMFAPIENVYRVTIDQMILLEPALVESITAPLVKGIRMAVDACVDQGVPRDAVMAFVMGHLKVQFGVLFDFAGFPFSDGANLALNNAMNLIFKPNWIENIMSPSAVNTSVYNITNELIC